jgi:hypothetical protein
MGHRAERYTRQQDIRSFALARAHPTTFASDVSRGDPPMKSLLQRRLGVVAVVVVALGAAVPDARAASAPSASRHLTGTQLAPVHRLQIRTDALSELCGAHKDVAPMMDAYVLSALLQAVRERPSLVSRLCEYWHSYRET